MPNKYYYNPVDGLTFDIQDVLENGGVYFLAEDMAKKDKAERKIFISSVLLGASLAFLIDIIINLVIKWRDLSKRQKKGTTVYTSTKPSVPSKDLLHH